MTVRIANPLTLGLVLGVAIGAASPVRAADKVQFNRDIRPILSDNCFQCHGPDKNQRKAKLRLDERDVAVQRGAIVPGKPDESDLMARITSSKPREIMPPPDAHKKLSAAQKALLRRWIAEGAEYQPHWAYLPPKRGALPQVKKKAWIRNPIDAFILHALEARKLQPSPEADRRTLIRRLSLDLIGLPPTPDEVQAFLDDRDPKAYERLVDLLLKSPHYGERMAVPWLDLVRFSDTVGYHGDQNQNIFAYRDYVIDSFHRNKPFDQFTIEQLAGDLLPKPSIEQRVATGFNRLNMMTREGGAQPKEYLAKYAADRVRTVSMAWLGSTMGCAECHDHKYDPFTMKDFYALAAFFADIRQWGVYSDYAYTPNPDLKGFTNDHPFPPEIEITSPYLLRRRERLVKEREQIGAATAVKVRADTAKWTRFLDWSRAAAELLQQHPSGWVVPAVKAGPGAQVQEDGSVLFTHKAKKGDRQVLALESASGWVAALRIEALPHEKHQGAVVRDAAANALIQLNVAIRHGETSRETPLAFFHADADEKEPRYANGAPILSIKDGWRTSSRHRKSRQTSLWLLDQPIKLGAHDQLIVTVKSDNIGCLRIGVSPFSFDSPRAAEVSQPLARALAAGNDARSAGEVALAYTAFLLGTGFDEPEFAKARALQREIFDCRDGKASTLVTAAIAPLTTRVLPRGNWQDESGEVVMPGVPHFLPQPANVPGRRLNRLDLARWLVAPENPLTARVFVNRLWKQFFGTGLSSVLEDVGAQGEWPTHPELLDWLAVEFRESGWDVKHLVKLLVLSATYRQDARLRPELREIDPNNRLLASQSPRRLDAEFVRDNALAIAGLLNREIGGPSARPYQPAGYYANLQFPNRDYVAHTDDRQYRRGLYMHWQRTFLHPMLANFDAPSREECTANRILANTPQQALTLLNDPTFVEAARVLAQKVLAMKDRSDAERIDLLFQWSLARPAKAKERDSLSAFLDTQRRKYRTDRADAAKLVRIGLAPLPAQVDESELAAWTSVCRVLLSLHETITRY